MKINATRVAGGTLLVFFLGGLKESKSSEKSADTAPPVCFFFLISFSQKSPSPAAGRSSSKRNLFAWE